MSITDFHVHSRLDPGPCETPGEMIRLAKKCGIGRICLLGDVLYFGEDPSEEQIRNINDQTLELVDKWPDVFLGFCFLNPKLSENFLRAEAERCLGHQSFKGIKLEIAVNAADPRVDKVMRIAGDMDAIVVQHSWNTEIINNRRHQSDPEDVAVLARRFPRVRIVMAHITAASQRGVLAIAPCENVWTDVSGAQPVGGTVEYAVDKLGSERILFGSDAPGRDFSAQLGKIYGAQIPERVKEMILKDNAQKLLESS